VQQEELRTANEELGEQSRVLTESQQHLEHQQAELEATNSQLAEQASVLDRKNEALNDAQLTLQERADELQRASRYKSEFLANMSHELRTPLNSSLILAKLLSENKDGQPQRGTAEVRADDLRRRQRPAQPDQRHPRPVQGGGGPLDLQPQFVSVPRLIESLQRTFTPLANEKKLVFEVHWNEPDAPASMVTDNLRVEQILKNLLSNAFKFTDAGSVSLSVQFAAGRPRRVRGEGLGHRHSRRPARTSSSRPSARPTAPSTGATAAPAWACRSRASSRACWAARSRWRARSAQGSTFTLTLPTRWTDVPEPTDDRPAHCAITELAARARPPASRAVAAPSVTPARPRRPPWAQDVPPRSPTTRDSGRRRPEKGRVLLVVEDDETFAGVLYNLAHEMRYRCLVAQTRRRGAGARHHLLAQRDPAGRRLPDGRA
jgi:hypothetical protein